MLEFSLGGFIYAIINFLLLAWLLKLFFHRPLMAMLEKRQKRIQTEKETAETLGKEAEKLRKTYEDKLGNIESERAHILGEARESAETQKQQTLQQARQSAEKERENAQREWQRQQQEAFAALRQDIAQSGVALAAKILAELNGPSVSEVLADALHRALTKLAEKDAAERADLSGKGHPVRVSAAATLDKDTEARLVTAIQAVTGNQAQVTFAQDPELIAGQRVEFVSQAVDASVKGMLDSVLQDVRQRLEPRPQTESAKQPADPTPQEANNRAAQKQAPAGGAAQ